MRNILVPTVLCALAFFVHPLSSAGATDPAFDKGRQAYEDKDYALAVQQFQLADRKMDRDPKLHYYLANALALTGNYEEARKHYEKSIKLGPSSEAGKLARVGLSGITSPPPVSSNFASFPSTTAVSQGPDMNQAVHQFVQDLNNQVADRKQLAAFEAAYNQTPTYSPYPNNYGWGGYPRHRHRPFMPMYNAFYGGNNYIASNNYRHRVIYYTNYSSGSSNYGGDWNYRHNRDFSGYYGHRGYYGGPESGFQNIGLSSMAVQPVGYNSYGYLANQRSLGFEQAAAGLESQMLNDIGGVKINPKGTNLYVRNYGSGIVPPYQPPPVIELLAKQEKLVIDDPKSPSKTRH